MVKATAACLLPKTHGEGKWPLPSPCFGCQIWCQKHTVRASGRCLHHGLDAKFGAKNTRSRQAAVAFTMVLLPKTHGEGKRPLPSPCFGCQIWCQKHTVRASGRCLHHGLDAKFGAKNTRSRQAAVAFTMVLLPKPLPSPCFGCQIWCQKHTVRASGRCLHHGLDAKFGAKNTRSRQAAVAFTMVLLPKTHGEGKRPLPSPCFGCQKHTVKASGRCLHHGFAAKNTR